MREIAEIKLPAGSNGRLIHTLERQPLNVLDFQTLCPAYLLEGKKHAGEWLTASVSN